MTVLTYKKFQRLAAKLRAGLFTAEFPVVNIQNLGDISYAAENDCQFDQANPALSHARIEIRFLSPAQAEAFDTIFEKHGLLILDSTIESTSITRVLNWAVASDDRLTLKNIEQAYLELSAYFSPNNNPHNAESYPLTEDYTLIKDNVDLNGHAMVEARPIPTLVSAIEDIPVFHLPTAITSTENLVSAIATSPITETTMTGPPLQAPNRFDTLLHYIRSMSCTG